MKKITLTIISMLVLCGLVYGQDAPEDGVHKEYYEDGKLKLEMHYKNGKPDGLSKMYDRRGILVFGTNYSEGKIIDSRGYHENGKLRYIRITKENKMDGYTKTFYEDGTLKQEVDSNNWGKTVFTKYYYPNGNIAYELIGKNHNIITYREYSEEGELLSEETIDGGDQERDKIKQLQKEAKEYLQQQEGN